MNSGKIQLTVTRGLYKGERFEFKKPARYIIGRSEDCDIPLPTNYVHANISRHHCALEVAMDPPSVQVIDLGSRNGTYVNEEKIGQRESADPSPEYEFAPHALADGDELRVGDTIFRVGIVNASDSDHSRGLGRRLSQSWRELLLQLGVIPSDDAHDGHHGPFSRGAAN